MEDRDTGLPVLGLRLLVDMPLRDPSVCRGPDGTWYLTGTAPPGWGQNQGVALWCSPDMRAWTALGTVWEYGQSPWHRPYKEAGKPLWAPEVFYLHDTFWLTYSMPGWDGTAATSGSGLLRSLSGRARGPYVDVQPECRLGDEIDASLFVDGNGTVYFAWHSGKLAPMRPDMGGLAGPCTWLRTARPDADPRHHSSLCPLIFGSDSHDHVGYEGMFLFRADGRYYLCCGEHFHGRYSCAVASADHLTGPYGDRYEAIPHAGHTMFFADADGSWWCTYFGSDPSAPWQEKPGLVAVDFAPDGRVHPVERPGWPR